MKKSIILFVLFACMSVYAIGQTKYATIHVIEGTDKFSSLTIAYENLETETIALQGIGQSLPNPDALVENQKTITDILNKMASKGYVLVSESLTTYGYIRYTNYTFKKG